MAEYLIQGETLTNMADKIRILSGTEGTMTTAQMDSSLGDANTEVDSQADLLAQAVAALEGKAAGGSGGGSLEPYTITVESNIEIDWYYAYNIEKNSVCIWLPCYSVNGSTPSIIGGIDNYLLTNCYSTDSEMVTAISIRKVNTNINLVVNYDTSSSGGFPT